MKMFGLISLALSLSAFSASVTGDLNKDGLDDQAEIVWKEGSKNLPNLIITLNGKISASKKIQSPKAICLGCGGPKAIMGHPLGLLSITKNVLNITYEGGARSVWKEIYKWRLSPNKKDFILIGLTYRMEDNFGEYGLEKIDANYSTGKVDRSVGKIRKACSFKAKTVFLATFDYENDSITLLDDLKKSCFIKEVL